MMVKFLCKLPWVLLMLLGAAVTHAAEETAIPAMLERVLPAVVTVAVEETATGDAPYGFAGGSAAAYRRVLDLAGASSCGSGFLIEYKRKTYVITNAHVVESAAGDQGLFVYTPNQTKYPVRVVGGDTFYDIAVLAFTENLPEAPVQALTFRDDDIAIGERVFAIGNARCHKPYSISDGIIGGKNRFLDGLTSKFGHLQSTATVTWGNSGGPLVDANGHVVGINSRIEINEKEGQMIIHPQMNYALEGLLAQRLIHDILTHDGRVRRAFLGIEVAEYVSGKSPRGMAVNPLVLISVMPDSPAAAVLGDASRGLRMVAINGVKTRNVEEVLGALEQVAPGAEVTLTLENRRGQVQDFTIASTELTLERLAAWARYFLNRHGAAEATEHRGMIRLRVVLSDDAEDAHGQRRIPQKVSLFVNEEGDLQKQHLEAMNHAALETFVVLAGAYPNDFWRVRSLADLGIAVRLAALGGYVHLIPWKGDNERLQILQIGLTDEPGMLAKTLFY